MNSIADKLRGRFLVIDGPDGAGKSTQIKLLAEHLRAGGVELVLARDPGGTAIGDKIRAILLDRAHDEMSVACELMLYMASRAQLVYQVIRPALAAGKCVLCDRYVSSTIAYQGAGGADIAAIRSAAQLAVDGAWPDLTLIVDVPSDVGLSRVGRTGGPDRMEAKAAAFHARVRELFLQQAADEPSGFAVVDGSGDVGGVQDRLRRAIKDWQPKRDNA